MTIVLATSNGTGMGHLARQAAVAGELAGRATPVIFSLSTAVHVVAAATGIGCEYCPSHHRGWMPHAKWHAYLGARLSALLAETGASVLAFDGVAPYLGLLRTRRRNPHVRFVWVRRGLWRREAAAHRLGAAAYFDAVVEPGDFAAAADRGPTASATGVERIPPISLVDTDAPLGRAEAAAALGLDPGRPTALVTLGAGTINDTATPGVAAIAELVADPAWQVAVVRPPLAVSEVGGGSGVDIASRLHRLVGIYPLARYLSAFDAAVSAAGYNAVHELLAAGIPTLLVPNPHTATDDQVARARWCAATGAALTADETPEAVAAGVRRLLDPDVRRDLRAATDTLPRPEGAGALADLLVSLAQCGGSRPWSGARSAMLDARLTTKAAGMRVLGPEVVALARRMLGRNPPAGPTRPLRVEPEFTEGLDPDRLRQERPPIEHLLPGTGPNYRTTREAIARAAYRWSG